MIPERLPPGPGCSDEWLGDDCLDLADDLRMTSCLGPGRRMALWTQGCPRYCEGCISPEYRRMGLGTKVRIDALAARISKESGLEGITVSGGEPLLQARQLCSLFRALDARRLGIIVFSGFLLEELRASASSYHWIDDCLACIDLLIDGPYIEALNDGRGLRGSSNQRFHFLTERYRPYAAELSTAPRRVELSLSEDGIDMIGVPGKIPAPGGPSGADTRLIP